MIWIYPEQLLSELKIKIKSVYILLGNDLYLLLNSHTNILKKIKQLYDVNHRRIESIIDFNWEKTFNLCKTNELFSQKQILSLQFPKDYSISIFNKNIPILSSLIHDDLILILLIYTFQQHKQYYSWIKLFNNIGIVVNCNIPKNKRLELWIKNQSKNMKLTMENLACQLLCYYYEGNTMLLHQILQHLSLIYPDGYLSFSRIQNIINDSAYFNYNHCIESILTGKKKRANRILVQLKHMHIDLKTLLYKIQCDVLIILKIKNNLIKGKHLYSLFKEYEIYTQYRRFILSQAIHRLNLEQLYKSISLLTAMEVKYYQNYTSLSQLDFKLLIEILCNPH